ncbi:hypothetical protein QT995_08885 [Microcoleus sp. S36b_A3]|uniref:hypothetical protein n=2 Tax=Microcoleus TaxID=44471 RepID=UPI002FD6A62B
MTAVFFYFKVFYGFRVQLKKVSAIALGRFSVFDLLHRGIEVELGFKILIFPRRWSRSASVFSLGAQLYHFSNFMLRYLGNIYVRSASYYPLLNPEQLKAKLVFVVTLYQVGITSRSYRGELPHTI